MEIRYNKEETIFLIEEYFKKLEGRNVKASIKVEAECVGLYEDVMATTTITVKEKINVMGIEKEVVQLITEKDLKNYLNALCELEGNEVTSLFLDSSLTTRCEGYGCCEREVKRTQFKGTVVNISKKKNMSLQKIRGV